MKHNSNIGCTVNECKHHCLEDNHCTLNKIEIVKNTSNASCVECTDCASFEKK